MFLCRITRARAKIAASRGRGNSPVGRQWEDNESGIGQNHQPRHPTTRWGGGFRRIFARRRVWEVYVRHYDRWEVIGVTHPPVCEAIPDQNYWEIPQNWERWHRLVRLPTNLPQMLPPTHIDERVTTSDRREISDKEVSSHQHRNVMQSPALWS